MEYEIKPEKRFYLNLGELWAFRELFFFFVWRDIKVKYKQTVLGATWAILQPLLLMAMFTLFFSRSMNIDTGHTSYPVFVLSALIMWNIFSSGVSAAGNSMVTNANIIKKIYFPRLIIPVSSVLSALFDFLIAFFLFIALVIYYGQLNKIPLLLLHLPLSLIAILLLTFGLGCFLAALNIRYRDFKYIIPFMIQVMFFLSPIIYPFNHFGTGITGRILSLNPITGPIEFLRESFTGLPVHSELLIYSCISSLLIFIFGVYYFKKTEAYFADIV